MEKKLRVASLCVQGGYEPKNGEPIELPTAPTCDVQPIFTDELHLIMI